MCELQSRPISAPLANPTRALQLFVGRMQIQEFDCCSSSTLIRILFPRGFFLLLLLLLLLANKQKCEREKRINSVRGLLVSVKVVVFVCERRTKFAQGEKCALSGSADCARFFSFCFRICVVVVVVACNSIALV